MKRIDIRGFETTQYSCPEQIAEADPPQNGTNINQKAAKTPTIERAQAVLPGIRGPSTIPPAGPKLHTQYRLDTESVLPGRLARSCIIQFIGEEASSSDPISSRVPAVTRDGGPGLRPCPGSTADGANPYRRTVTRRPPVHDSASGVRRSRAPESLGTSDTMPFNLSLRRRLLSPQWWDPGPDPAKALDSDASSLGGNLRPSRRGQT
eukprot:755142-Hanusia_phi.AAC.6